MKDFIYNFIKGMGMGAANVIPGVSGGTIALITGIFERLINSIKSFNLTALKLFFTGKWKAFAQHVDLKFLVAVFLGIAAAILSVAKLFKFLFENYPVYIWAFFFGLIIASIYYVGRTVNKWNLGSILFFSIGTGIGGAFLIDGRPFRGYNNTGGEIGHMITHADGLPCACGGRGCFEQYASATALSRMAGGIPVPEVFARAEAGDPSMSDVLDAYAHELAVGLSGLFAVFRPQVLVIGGGVSEAGEPFLRRVRFHAYEKCPSTPAQEKPDIRLARLGNMAGVIGGAALAAAAE